MPRLYRALREHRHFFIVVTLLTLATTFPTIIYVFRTDVFWLPTGTSLDIFIELWDIWYNKLILTGQANRFFTTLIYYPAGVSLAYDPMFPLFNTVVNILQLIMPLSSAYCLTFLLLIGVTALSAYSYALWIFEDKWIALLAAVIFAFSPQVIGHPHWPKVAWIWPLPIILYFAHRGIAERRASLVVLAGILSGFTAEIVHYNFICTVITLTLAVFALAVKSWRDRQFWGCALLLVTVSALSCAWRVLPLLEQSELLGHALDYYGSEVRNDLMSFVVNPRHPILGPLGAKLLRSPPGASFSSISYLGFVPLALVGIGIYDGDTRRKMLPWLGLLLVFVILHLGSTLNVNGVEIEGIRLPKHYLDQILPSIFRAFVRTNHFMAGVCLPLAVLACYGLSALRSRYRQPSSPAFVLLLLGLVAFEYFIPIPAEFKHEKLGRLYMQEGPAFVDWLEAEEEENISLIHVPLGRVNSKYYYFFQLLSGYPQTEGAISRVPDSAYDYMRGNHLLDNWLNQRPATCDFSVQGDYLAGLTRLDTDGFSHVVYHPDLDIDATIAESFQYIEPAYEDEYVQIYRLGDMRNSCADEVRRSGWLPVAYSDALEKSTVLAVRQGAIVIFPATPAEGDRLLGYLRRFRPAGIHQFAVSRGSSEDMVVQSSEPGLSSTIDYLESQAGVWLLSDRIEFNAARSGIFHEWFSRIFKACHRHYQDHRTTIDIYLKLDIPCSAVDHSSALDVRYDGGARLHNISFEIDPDRIRFYTAWTNNAPKHYSFSLQFFDDSGRKALQYDSVVYRDLLSTHEIDVALLPAGAYSVQLIVYDFETQISRGGLVAESGRRFERELEVARIEL